MSGSRACVRRPIVPSMAREVGNGPAPTWRRLAGARARAQPAVGVANLHERTVALSSAIDMTPQSTFMVLAPIAVGAEDALDALLASMNLRPGVVDPFNALVPFGKFDKLHFARFVILEGRTGGDVNVYCFAPSAFPRSLAFLGDCDGPADTFLSELVGTAGSGLRRVFAHCEGLTADTDLSQWMNKHQVAPSATYVNWIGRTVQQILENDELRKALWGRWKAVRDQSMGLTPLQLCAQLFDFVDSECREKRLSLTPSMPTPLGWCLRNWAHLIGGLLVLAAAILLSPLLLIATPIFLLKLRALEKSDPEIVPRPDEADLRSLAAIEDHDFTNQFSAFGDIKPGVFRKYLVVFLLWALDYASRHIYRRGYLTRVQTIHFARWVLIDNKKRMFFASNYDGSLDSYMDDFINKVAWGINLVFSNGVGFPRTSWLLCGGAGYERKYNCFLHRHQLPTAVWYKAYPGLSVADLNRNSRIRQGVDRRHMSDKEARKWLSLL